MAKWSRIDEAKNDKDGKSELLNQPLWITDGARVAFAKLIEMPFDKNKVWVSADPAAEGLKLASQIEQPTHYTHEIDIPAEAKKIADERNEAADKEAREAIKNAPKRPEMEEDENKLVLKNATVEVKK